ncbi:MAG TPA: AAA family ATPase [Fusobacterium sp.]|uniref:ATP-dependent nuclease n=1 Tax=Fusobacterium sp. TaxID=68766 RepID=UPI002F422ACE
MIYKFRIDKIIVNTADGIEEIVPKKVNVIVGPNNSGKSRLLKEIRDYLSGDNRDIKIINSIEHPFPKSFSELDKVYNVSSKMVKNQYGNWMLKSYSNKPTQVLDMTSSLESYFTRSMNTISGDWREHFARIIERKDENEFFNWYGSLFYQYIGTEERLTICKTQKNYGIDSNNTNYLSSFKYKSKTLDDLSVKVKQFFKKDIYLDAQTLGDRLVFRVGDNFDSIRSVPNSSEDIALRIFSENILDEQGDGLKSFVSTFLSLNYKKNNILLLDEPEAFLHPPLARQLGEMIGDSYDEDRTIFVATHSVEILKGILTKNQDINVIRITRSKDEKNNIMVLNQEILGSILQNPLLRVSRVLEGVFCDKVILTEAETDELVYQELSEKIIPESGVYFAHGQNKQTLANIAELYQKIGVAYEIVTDFDVLRVSSEFNKFLLLMPIEEKERKRIEKYAERLRKIIDDSVDVTGLSEQEIEDAKKKKRNEVYHKQGIHFFDDELKIKIRETLDYLSLHHLHILETGELETLLEEYEVPYKEKRFWIIDAINKIAELTNEDIQPKSKIYQFIHKIITNK